MKTIDLDPNEVVCTEGARWHIEIVEDGSYKLRLHIETYGGWCNIGSIKYNSDGFWTIDIDRDSK